MKKQINVFDYAGHICKSVQKGVLLTTKADERVNTMTIGWGTLGIQWNRPIFIAYVRNSRFTRDFLDRSGKFTVNIPMESVDGNILNYCGRNSGRDVDKIKDLGLTLIPGDAVDVPAIAEFPLTLECRVVYQQGQEPETIPQDILNRFYPACDEKDTKDLHIAYYGEIQAAYILELD